MLHSSKFPKLGFQVAASLTNFHVMYKFSFFITISIVIAPSIAFKELQQNVETLKHILFQSVAYYRSNVSSSNEHALYSELS